MKSLVEYINESIITEKFGSKILTDLFTSKSQKGWAWDKISSSLKWDKITDADIEELSIKDAIKISKDDNDDYIIYASKNHAVFARTIGTTLLSVEDKISTITGLSRKYNLDKAYRILNWEGFSTSALHKERYQMSVALKHIHDNEIIHYDNEDRYIKSLNRLHATKLLDSDYEKALTEMIEMLALVTKYIANDENAILTKAQELMDAQNAFHSVIDDLKNLIKFKDPNYEDDILWVKDDGDHHRVERINKDDVMRDISAYKSDEGMRWEPSRFRNAVAMMKQAQKGIQDLYNKYKDQLGDYKVEGF